MVRIKFFLQKSKSSVYGEIILFLKKKFLLDHAPRQNFPLKLAFIRTCVLFIYNTRSFLSSPSIL